MDHDPHEPSHRERTFWRSRYAIGLVEFAAIALFFLLSEHRAHTLGALPYLLLAASPLLLVFVHHGPATATGAQILTRGRWTTALRIGERPMGAPERRTTTTDESRR